MISLIVLVCLWTTVMQSRDPSTNVVLLEDAAAVLGVMLAAGCMGLTSLTGKNELNSFDVRKVSSYPTPRFMLTVILCIFLCFVNPPLSTHHCAITKSTCTAA